MTVKLIRTTISEASISMRYADDTDPTKALEWIDFRIPFVALDHLRGPNGQKLGDPESQYLATVQQAALRYVRDLVAEEIRGLASRAGHWS
jgi:hypothetical protein